MYVCICVSMCVCTYACFGVCVCMFGWMDGWMGMEMVATVRACMSIWAVLLTAEN